MKIEKLTPEQEAMIPIIRNEWIAKCGTLKLDREQAKKSIEWLYEFSNLKKPNIVFFSSPLACQFAANIIKGCTAGGPAQVGEQVCAQVRQQVWDQVRDQVRQQIRAQVRDQVRDQVWDQVWDQVRDQVWDQVRQQVGAQVGDQVWDQVRDQVRAQVWQQIRAQVRAQVWQQIRAQVRDQVWQQIRAQVRDQVGQQVCTQVWQQIRAQVRDQVWQQIRAQVRAQKLTNFDWAYYGSITDYGWLAWSNFFHKMGLFKHEGFDQFNKLLDSGIYDMLQFEGWCFVCEHPKALYRNDEGQLHADGKAAIEWEDGFKLFFLNGVAVEPYLALTPAGNLDIKYYHEQTSADIKAEFLRKYGIDRLADQGKVIDSYKNYKDLNPLWTDSQYELIDMAPIHEGLSKALYLKMKNLTVKGLYHMEGVDNSCRTIHDAIKDRWEEDVEQYETIAVK